MLFKKEWYMKNKDDYFLGNVTVMYYLQEKIRSVNTRC